MRRLLLIAVALAALAAPARAQGRDLRAEAARSFRDGTIVYAGGTAVDLGSTYAALARGKGQEIGVLRGGTPDRTVALNAGVSALVWLGAYAAHRHWPEDARIGRALTWAGVFRLSIGGWNLAVTH